VAEIGSTALQLALLVALLGLGCRYGRRAPPY
jgi:hypothetical protein